MTYNGLFVAGPWTVRWRAIAQA